MSTQRTPEPATKAAHDAETPQALIDFMATGWLDRPLAAARHPQAERHAARREALSRASSSRQRPRFG